MLTIYTKTGCPYCAAALASMDEQGLEYREINLSLAPEKIPELLKVSGGKKVPVIIDGDRVTVGFKGGG